MLEQYYKINKAAGVSITILQNGSVHINACGVAVNHNQLDFEKKVIDLNTIEDLANHFPPKSYVSLNLSGKGILQKQIEKIEDIDQQNFNKVVPNAVFDDFYIQNFISGDQSFVAIIRKTEADKWIEQLKNIGFTPLMLSLGPFPVQNITNQLNVYDKDVVFNGHLIKRNERLEWVSYQYNEATVSPFPLKVESEGINEKLVVPYAVAFQLVVASKVQPITAAVPELETAFSEVLSDKKLKVSGFLILAVFFLLLLINFILLSSLNDSNIKLADQVSRLAQSTVDIQSITGQVKDKEHILQNLGWDGGINKSALVDKIALVLPEELKWQEVAINPIDLSASRTQKTLVFLNREIQIIGNSDKIIPVNEWMARIKTQAWVKNIQLVSYTFNNEQNTGQFTVTISY